MACAEIIDALFCIPRSSGSVLRISDCAPFSQNLAPLMLKSRILGAVLAPSNCSQCQHQWNCADRMTHEILGAVAQSPKRLRGLGSYDPLRIGESLRWIDEAVASGGLVGTYVPAECCASGLDAPRMYPLYGLCAKLRLPVVIDIASRERWLQHRPKVEVVAADFPELDILLAPPPHTEVASFLWILKRFPRISFLLCAQELRANPALCDYVEIQGRERTLFRSASNGWQEAVDIALALPLGAAARRAYLSENAARLFRFRAELSDLVA